MAFASVMILAVIVGTAIANEDTARPGFRGRITQRGLNYGADVAIDFLMANMQELDIPPKTLSAAGSTLTIKNMRITNFPRPTATVFPSPGRGLTFVAMNVSPTIQADFVLRAYVGFWTFVRRGHFVAETNDLSFTLDFAIGRDSEGRPMPTEVDCVAEGSDIDITFHGELSSFLNFAFRAFESKVKSSIKSQLCDNAKNEINTHLSSELATFSTVLPIDEDYVIDYRLVSDPVFTSHFLENNHKAAILLRSDLLEPPFQPPVIPPHPEHTDRMIYLYVTDYLMNSGLLAAYRNGIMAYSVTPDVVPEEARPILRTTCPEEFCLGTLFPTLRETYPNAIAEIDIRATSAPVGTVSGDEIAMSGAGEARFFVRSGETRQPIFTVSMSTSGSVRILVVENRVVFNITSINPRAVVQESFIGDVDEGFSFEEIMTPAFQQLLYPALREMGGHGFDLPSAEGVRFVNSEVIDHDTENVFIIATDMSYEPVE